ncbi:riboflavin biosynthesis protein RibD [Fulvitalea axinellae]|uniref:Riboflavin biosynthesis protein RibD n=1 Tax=Fulvitalea axinellae TaxID=1182444 RepID=A0AAU9CSE2_9BACT|nr:riboflavin biosynthesis protein RibD [Fulvitalea axinellae]
MSIDETYMRRALELARLGLGSTYPNPMVGCVIVRDGKIIGEGWHQKAGEPHAEVLAVRNTGNEALVQGADVYVTLEPCAHYGKTPPCAELLARLKPARVVICNVDSNPLVGGKGIRKMEEVGIKVETGVLEEEGRWLNRRFFTFMEKKRPYIVLKWAQTDDGFVARENYDSKWISSPLSRKLVHKWRSEEPAILVGRNTAFHDDPELTVRDWTGEHPLRIVIDRGLSLPENLKLLDRKQPTIRYNLVNSETHGALENVALPEDNFIEAMLANLYRRNIHSVFVEGGARFIEALAERGLWDEARIFTASKRFGKGIGAPALNGHLYSKEKIGDDELKIITR